MATGPSSDLALSNHPTSSLANAGLAPWHAAGAFRSPITVSLFEIWRDAVRKYEKSTGKPLSLAASVQDPSHDFDAFFDAIKKDYETYMFHATYRERLEDVLAPVLRIVRDLEEIYMAGETADNPLVSFYYRIISTPTAVKHFIVSSVGNDVDYHNIIELFKRMDEFVSRLKIYEMSGIPQELCTVLVDSLVHMLIVLREARKTIQKKGLMAKTLKSLLSDKTKTEKLLKEMDLLSARENSAMWAFSFQGVNLRLRQLENLLTGSNGTKGIDSSSIERQPKELVQREHVLTIQTSHMSSSLNEVNQQTEGERAHTELTIFEHRGRDLSSIIDHDPPFQVADGETGSFGEVIGAFLPQGQPVVIKLIRDLNTLWGSAFKAKRNIVARELDIWMSLHHPNVLPLYGYAVGGTLGSLPCFVSPCIPEGTISHYLDAHPKIRPDERLSLINGVAFGLSYLHTLTNPVVHGDLKPNNVLVSIFWDGEKIRLRTLICDFGFARIVGEHTLQTKSYAKNTHGYRAWEIHHIDRFRKEYPLQLVKGNLQSMELGLLRSDVWSWAMIALRVLSDEDPDTLDGRTVLKRWRDSEALPCDVDVSFCEQNGLEGSYWKTMQRCWSWNPEERPTMPQVIADLQIQEPSSHDNSKGVHPDSCPPPTGLEIDGHPVHFLARAIRPSHAIGRASRTNGCLLLKKNQIIAVSDDSSDGWWSAKCILTHGSEGWVDPSAVEETGTRSTNSEAYFSVVTCRSQKAKEELSFNEGQHLIVCVRSDCYWGFHTRKVKSDNRGKFPCNHVDRTKYRHVSFGDQDVLFYAEVKKDFDGTIEEVTPEELRFETNELIAVTQAPRHGPWHGIRVHDNSDHPQEAQFDRDAVKYPPNIPYEGFVPSF